MARTPNIPSCLWRAAAVAVVLFFAACESGGTESVATDSSTTASQETASSVAQDGSTPSSILEVPPIELPESPSPTGIEVDVQNRNTPDGGIGSLCWARWEVARHIILVATNEAEAETRLPALDEALARAAAAVADVEVPDPIQPFVDRFRAAVQTGLDAAEANSSDPATRLEQLDEPFDFQSYPAVEEYERLATASPSCPRP